MTQTAARRTTDFRDLTDGYRELDTHDAVTLHHLGRELDMNTTDLVALAPIVATIPGWVIEIPYPAATAREITIAHL